MSNMNEYVYQFELNYPVIFYDIDDLFDVMTSLAQSHGFAFVREHVESVLRIDGFYDGIDFIVIRRLKSDFVN